MYPGVSKRQENLAGFKGLGKLLSLAHAVSERFWTELVLFYSIKHFKPSFLDRKSSFLSGKSTFGRVNPHFLTVTHLFRRYSKSTLLGGKSSF